MKKNIAKIDHNLILGNFLLQLNEKDIFPFNVEDIINEIQGGQISGHPPPRNLLAKILNEQYPESITTQKVSSEPIFVQPKNDGEKTAEKQRKRVHHNQEKNNETQTQKKINTGPLKLGPGFNLLYEMGKRHYPELHNHDN